MTPIEIADAISELALEPFDRAEFPFQFLAAFGNKETTLKKLRAGASNASDLDEGVLQRNNIHIATCAIGAVNATLTALRESPKTASAKVKFILATDGEEFQAEDLASGETVACDYTNFDVHFGFFLPLAGVTNVKEIKETELDRRAASRLKKLYVELLSANSEWAGAERREDINKFMARLIFCFFAEDTDIIHPSGLFTRTIEQMGVSDASDTHHVISEIFRAMDVKLADRDAAALPIYTRKFPYVNGSLFSGSIDCPRFTKIARSYLMHIGSLDWQKINPDIFGSMIQAVADDEERGTLGMHYTSVPNILKVLNPLFLDDLREKLEEAADNPRKLLNLRSRIAKIRVFDPACGSGNFLVIAYKEMRAIEAQINKMRGESDRRSDIPITNYRGIELKDFAAEVARLALIIAEYQCDVLYRGQKEALAEFLPLNSQNWIVCGNSLRLDWLSICPPTGSANVRGEELFTLPLNQPDVDFENQGGEIYICANPPFAGQKKKTDSQRDDMAQIMPRYMDTFGELDYVCAFYVKAAAFARETGSAVALVSTNSVIQGRHVPILWPAINKMGLEIVFGYRSFPWGNNAAKNASVYCVIIGLAANWKGKKHIYDGTDRIEAQNINGYLINAPNIQIQKRKHPLSSDLQAMKSGNMPLDNGHLLLDRDEAQKLKAEYPDAAEFIRKTVGAKEINQGLVRHCLWIGPDDLDRAIQIPPIAKRIEACANFRRTSSAPDLASRAHQFRDTHSHEEFAIVLPNLSSEKRGYRVPIVVQNNVIPTNLALAIYDGGIFQIGIIASRLHHLWVEAVCGKLKMDYRYSNDLGWHTFPMPKLTDTQREALERTGTNILIAHEAAFPASLNDLYNTDQPLGIDDAGLRRAHDENDEVLERIYIGRRFKNDTERLEKLFELYTKIIAKGRAS